jgi:predicted lipoprotein with Yx(FWY)xxD motif
MKRLSLTLVAVAVSISLAVGLSGALGATRSTGRTTAVKTARSSLGTILVDGQGRTLYLFEKDKRGRSACSGICAAYWPPLLTRGRPTVGRGVKRSLLGVTRRRDGTSQVTYAGHPLYRFVQDTRPGQTTGQGSILFGAGWYVVSPAGRKVRGLRGG